MGSAAVKGQAERIDWVDYAKGFCIIFVVMMHSTLGVEAAAGQLGWMHYVVEFAKPFRMPDFFLISGLFLARVIDRDWMTYLDRKVVHFLYFYVLWVTIQFAFKAPGFAAEHGAVGTGLLYLQAFVEPFGTLWFIYLLPVFFVLTKLTRNVPVVVIWSIAALMEILPIHTGWLMVDEFASRFVYFYTGYVAASYIFTFAAGVQLRSSLALAFLFAWGVLNYVFVFRGWAELPMVSLALGFLGAAAVVAASAMMARIDLFAPLRWFGEHSIVIYLAFFLPMAITRTVLLKTGIITDLGTISLLVTAAGVIGPMLAYVVLRNTWFRFLFDRPDMFTLKPRRRMSLQPAE